MIEHLAVQPGGVRRESVLNDALPLALIMAARGVKMQTLYTHAARHGQGLYEYLERMGGAAEVRTLDEVIERLLIFDRKVAFVPATEDRTVALELRHPGLVQFLAIVFERLWRLGHPWRRRSPRAPGSRASPAASRPSRRCSPRATPTARSPSGSASTSAPPATTSAS